MKEGGGEGGTTSNKERGRERTFFCRSRYEQQYLRVIFHLLSIRCPSTPPGPLAPGHRAGDEKAHLEGVEIMTALLQVLPEGPLSEARSSEPQPQGVEKRYGPEGLERQLGPGDEPVQEDAAEGTSSVRSPLHVPLGVGHHAAVPRRDGRRVSGRRGEVRADVAGREGLWLDYITRHRVPKLEHAWPARTRPRRCRAKTAQPSQYPVAVVTRPRETPDVGHGREQASLLD